METNKNLSLPIYLIAGVLAGLGLALLIHYKSEDIFIYLWISFYGVMFLLAQAESSSLFKALLTTLIISFLACSPFHWINSSTGPNSIFLPIISAYALNSFHLAYQREGFKQTYTTLFHAVWNTFVKSLVTIFFIGICWLILKIWAALFDLISINLFTRLFNEPTFIIGITALFAAMGLYITEQANKVIQSIRFLLLLICKWLLPVLSIIGMLFLLCWALAAIFSTKAFSLNPYIFFAYSVVFILFLNGVLQDGSSEQPYNKILASIIKIATILFPFFALVILYLIIFPSTTSTGYIPMYQTNSISKQGLNSYNFNFLISAALLLLYSITYAFCAIRRRHAWTSCLSKSNIVLAVFVIIVNLIINNYFFTHADINPGKKAPFYNKPIRMTKQDIKKQYVNLSKKLAKDSFVWKQSKKGGVTLAIQNNKAFSVCRTKINKQFLPGILIQQKCTVLSNNGLVSAINYETLSGKASKLVWMRWFNRYYLVNPTSAIPVAINIKDKNISFICRTIYKNRLYLGISSLKDRSCRIVVNNKIVKTNALQYLYLQKKK